MKKLHWVPTQPGKFLQSLEEVLEHNPLIPHAFGEVVAHAYLNNELEALLRDIDQLQKTGIPETTRLPLTPEHLEEARGIALNALSSAAMQIEIEDVVKRPR